MRELPDRPFTTAMAHEAGITRHELRVAQRDGVVRRVLTGVYVRADLPDSIELRTRAVGLVVHPRTVVRDRTAAWLYDVDVFGWHEHELPPPVETAALRWTSVTRRTGCDGGTRDLAAGDVTRLHGLLVTTPLRTVLDLGCCLSSRDGLAALDQFMGRFGLTLEDFRRELPRYRRRRGVVQLRRLVGWADPRAESPAESWTRHEILSFGLPPPALQHWIEVAGVPTYRLDLAYPRLRIAVEYDGLEFHGVGARAHDEGRRRWLRDHGWYVIVLDKDSFTPEALDAWLTELRDQIAVRSARRGRR